MKKLAVVIIRNPDQMAAGERTARALVERGMDVRMIIVPKTGCWSEGESVAHFDDGREDRSACDFGFSAVATDSARLRVPMETVAHFLRESRYVVTI